MTTDSVIALLGLLVGFAAMLGAVWWQLSGRINDVRDQYARRDDVLQHVMRVEKTQVTMEASILAAVHETNRRIDDLIYRGPCAPAGRG